MPENEKLKNVRKYSGILFKQKEPLATGIWKDIAENLLPSREEMNSASVQRGKRRAKKIYDSSAMIYLNIFVDGFHGNTINQATTWFQNRLPANLRFLEKLPEVRAWLQNRQEMLYYYLAESNFYSVMREYIRDGGSIGTSDVYAEEDMGNGKIVFYCIHPREFAIAENQYGRVDVLSRRFGMTARQMKQKFGENKLPDIVKQSLKNDPFKEFDVTHIVYPNDEFDSRRLESQYKKFASKWFMTKPGNPHEDDFLAEKGYDDFPHMTWRYFRGDNAPYGDSPAIYALPDIMGLQAMGKSLLRAGHIAADPPQNVPSEMQGNSDLNPGGFNYYGPDYNRRIYPVTQGVNYPIALDREEKKRESIKEHFHVPYFMMLQQTTRTLTAREVMELTGEKASVISAASNDFMNILDSTLDYVAYLKRFELPPPPEVIGQYLGNRRIPIEYMGPLAQVQKNMFETRGITRFMDIVGQSGIMQLRPEIIDNFDLDGSIVDLAISNSFPQKHINSPEVIAEIRKGRQAAAAEEARKIDMDRIAEMLKKFAQGQKNAGGTYSNLLNELGTLLSGSAAPQPMIAQ